MDWDLIAPMVVGMTLFLTVGGVLIFRPLTKRLGDVIYMMQERKYAPTNDELKRIAQLMEHLDNRLDRLEHRQDFSERMLTVPEERSARARQDLEGGSKP